MPINDEKLYEEAAQAWRHFTSWREKTFAGYLTVLAALAIGFSQHTSAPVRAAIFAGGILVSAVFWILEFRNLALITVCQLSADRLERGRGCYAELNREGFDRKSHLTYGLAISLLVVAVGAASLGGLCIYMVRWWSGDLTLWPVWPFIAAGALAIAVPILLQQAAEKQRSAHEAQYRTPDFYKDGALPPAAVAGGATEQPDAAVEAGLRTKPRRSG